MPETLCGFSFLQCTTLLLFFASAEVNRGVTVTSVQNKFTDQEEDQQING